jgi:hypothetical protein
LDRQILFRTRFYFDRPTKFAPEQIVTIEVARPLPHGADLTAVFNFIGQRISDTRVNFGVQDHSGNRVIGPLPLVGLEILPALMPLACAAGSGGQPKGSRSVRKSDPSGKAPYVPPYDPYGPGVRA